MSVNSKMTALADEIRILSGTEGTMGLDAMKTNVNQANSNVNTEADLISQIQTALEGKAGGSGGASVAWQDVFALPTTYVVSVNSKKYYIEMPNDFKFIAIRFLYNNNYYVSSIAVMNDGSYISNSSNNNVNISVLAADNVICVEILTFNDSPVVSTAEYLIV